MRLRDKFVRGAATAPQSVRESCIESTVTVALYFAALQQEHGDQCPSPTHNDSERCVLQEWPSPPRRRIDAAKRPEQCQKWKMASGNGREERHQAKR